MKSFLFSLIAVATFSFSFKPATEAGYITEKFKVYGNCEMCKTRIEKALKVEGVRYAVWDQNTKMVTVKFNPEIVTLDELHQKCADVGHDTGTVTASDEVYGQLPASCQYREKV